MQTADRAGCSASNDQTYGRSLDPQDRLIVALDIGSSEAALSFADRLRGHCRWLKVGMELFYAEGRDLVLQLQDRGFCIFLDLKVHDIPNTAAAAVRSVGGLGVQILTVHTAGGPAMLEAVAAQARSLPQSPLLAGVTVLTSMDEAQLRSTGIDAPPEQQVLRLAALALSSGLKGLVASSLELRSLRRELGTEPILIVPGIRPAGSKADDQRRTATPANAIRDGASMLVIGRPITWADDPVRAVNEILVQIATELALQST